MTSNIDQMRADELARFEGIPSDDELGRIVREELVRYAEDHGDTNPEHLLGYDDLSNYDKEVDRRIGAAVARVVLTVLSSRVLPEIPESVFMMTLDDRKSQPWPDRAWVVDIHRRSDQGVVGIHSRAEHQNPVEAIRIALKGQ